jgi:hypothetical protein
MHLNSYTQMSSLYCVDAENYAMYSNSYTQMYFVDAGNYTMRLNTYLQQMYCHGVFMSVQEKDKCFVTVV